MVRSLVTALLCIGLAACGETASNDDGGVPGDAGTDARTAPVDIPWLERGVPDLVFTPCPAGWREVTGPDGVTTCDAYPAAGRAECVFGEAHFPGEAGCRPIGAPCPPGDWPADLPDDETTVVFVRPGAVAGDGSRMSPFGTLAEVPWAVRGPGWTIALAKGRYDGTIPIRGGVVVAGACAAETVVAYSERESITVAEVRGAGPQATLRDLAIVDAYARGVQVTDGGSLRIEGVLITNTTQLGLFIDDGGTVVEAEDLVIVGIQPRADGFFGYAISAEDGARFSGTRMVLADNHDISLFAQHNEGAVHVTDTAIFGTKARAADGTGGRAINVQNDVTLVAERLWMQGNRDVAFLVANASATLTDSVVVDTHAFESDGTDGRGIGVQEGATLEATRVAVSNSHDVGIVITQEGTAVTLTDVVVRDTREQESDGKYGRGINVQGGARLDATRVFVARSRDTGIIVTAGASATLTDVAVRDTREQGSDGYRGSGVIAQNGSTVEATHLLVAGSRENGILSVQATFTGREVVVADTERSACDCPGRVLGYGASVTGGSMTLDGFWVAGTATCGLFVSEMGSGDAAFDARRGVVEGAEIGACVQIPEYRLERLSDDVIYRDNGTNLDSTRLPVPEPSDDLSL